MNGEIIIDIFSARASDYPPFLYAMYQWGIEVIRVIQRIENPALTALIRFITALGAEALYVPLILFIFWWIDEKQGLKLGILILVSAWINTFVKDILKQPRPFNFDPSLGLAYEPTYGAPSGHAQNSIIFWIPMAAWLTRVRDAGLAKIKKSRGKVIWAAVIAFLLLMGFTRLYLGVHFPTDLFAGWLLGGLILVGWFVFGPRVEKFLASAGTRVQNIAVAILALLMNFLYPQGSQFTALFLGFCLGYSLMKNRVPFSARAPMKGKKPGVHVMILRCITGFAGMAIIYVGLRLVFPGEGSLFSGIPAWGRLSPFYNIGRFIRYCLIGFWASAGAPMAFQRMKLAPSPEGPPSDSGENNSGSAGDGNAGSNPGDES